MGGVLGLPAHPAKAAVPATGRPTAITFDVYGTLAQWDQTLAAAIGDILKARGRPDAGLALAVDACNAEALRLEAVGAFRSYRSILRDALRPALATAGLSPTASDSDMLIDRLGRVPPFPEAPGILARLAQGFRLSPISNSDDAFLAGTLNGLGPVFATTVTAEQAQAYKPNPRLFRYALDKLGVEANQLLHVAVGTFPDLAVCAALGIRVIWVNRKHESLQQGFQPIAVVDDLHAVPDIVASL